MPEARSHTFLLRPHPATQQSLVRRIGGALSRHGQRLQASYVVEGDLARLRIPPPGPSRFADGLWRHTCFEIFVARRGEPGYHEFNFSPSGEWAAYAFAGYREPLPFHERVAMAGPRVTVRRAAERLELEAEVDLAALSPHHPCAPLLLGLSAVIEAEDGTLSYWALAHPGATPDFHHPDTRVLDLDEIRN